ncbi:MAG: M16 family metallopeptidase [Polyangiales bacterium]
MPAASVPLSTAPVVTPPPSRRRHWPKGWTELTCFDFFGGGAVHHLSLPNGLQVLLLRDPAAPVISYHSWYRVGSRHERAGKTGLAHLLEHLMFGACEGLPPGDFDARLEAVGGECNAATWTDWTHYHIDLPKRQLALAIELEALRMDKLLLRPAAFRSEVEVVANERRERVDNDVDGMVAEALYALALPAPGYGHPTIGWMADIEDYALRDCRAFYRRHYSPSNATVVLVGDFDLRRAAALIEAHYGALPARPRRASAPPTRPASRRFKRRILEAPCVAPKIVRGYPAPGIGDDDWWALSLVAELLTGGPSSRLYSELVLEQERATSVHAAPTPFQYPGLFELSVHLRPGTDIAPMPAQLDAAIARLQQEPVRAAELNKAQCQLELGLLQGMETAAGKAEQLGFWATVTGSAEAAVTQLHRYPRVRPEDVQRVARRYLRRAALCEVQVRPQQEQAALAGRGRARAHAGHKPAGGARARQSSGEAGRVFGAAGRPLSAGSMRRWA